MMRRADLLSGIVLVVVGLVTIVLIIPWQIAPGPQGYMSPRLLPTMMMGLIVALSLGLVVRNLRPASAKDEPIFIPADGLAIVRIGGVFAMALTLYSWVSPLAAGLALVAGALVVLGERRPWVIVLMPAGLMLALWLLFYKVLGTAIV
jgi:hypothetical protein